jgi:indoleamine 2,3-dioxygenase
MPHPIPKLEDYGVDPDHGFLPSEPPTARLADEYYSPWESLVDDLQELITTKDIRTRVNALPILSTSKLTVEPDWRRAYCLLAFLAHGYIWSEEPAAHKLPPSISIPFLEASEHVGIIPSITYAALCIWNYKQTGQERINNPDDLKALLTFTGTKDESWFHMMSVAIEGQGAHIVPNLIQVITDVRAANRQGVFDGLSKTSEILGLLSPLLQRTHENLSPEIFFNNVRPFIAGSKSLPDGLSFDDGTGKEEYKFYGGASAAQSALFQFCDVAFGIKHGVPGDAVNAMVGDMRNYMPGCHRQFLEEVGKVANIKQFIHENQDDKGLVEAYNSCLENLKAFRNKHIGVVSRYIVLPSIAAAKTRSGTNPADGGNPAKAEITGTGGTMLMPFLKQMRDETTP